MVARIYNELNTARNSVCTPMTPLHTVLEQCSKYFRTVNWSSPPCDFCGCRVKPKKQNGGYVNIENSQYCLYNISVGYNLEI